MTLGVLVASGMRMPGLASASLVGVFAMFHGYAHASEAPVSPSVIPYASGFIVATVALHVFGIVVGKGNQRLFGAERRPARVLGSLIAAAGSAMLVF